MRFLSESDVPELTTNHSSIKEAVFSISQETLGIVMDSVIIYCHECKYLQGGCLPNVIFKV